MAVEWVKRVAPIFAHGIIMRIYKTVHYVGENVYPKSAEKQICWNIQVAKSLQEGQKLVFRYFNRSKISKAPR